MRADHHDVNFERFASDGATRMIELLLLASVQLEVLELLPLETPTFLGVTFSCVTSQNSSCFKEATSQVLSIVLVSATSRDVTVAIQLFLFEDCRDVT